MLSGGLSLRMAFRCHLLLFFSSLFSLLPAPSTPRLSFVYCSHARLSHELSCWIVLFARIILFSCFVVSRAIYSLRCRFFSTTFFLFVSHYSFALYRIVCAMLGIVNVISLSQWKIFMANGSSFIYKQQYL